ncbi:MAG: DNA-processing protein DprA [Clostridiales bacterium]|nr:DNA-processing protein DprA [Clostridiales bacterium]
MILSDLYLWLSYSHLQTSTINRLLDQMTVEQLWDAVDSDSSKKFSLSDKTLSVLRRTKSEEFIERAKQYLSVNHIEYVTRADPIFPEKLLQRNVNPPVVLYYRGNLDIARKKCLAVVGTRHATQYGKYAVNKIVPELTGKFTIVSGLATGIDGYAHTAALDAGGDTIAVLGSGLFTVTPASHARLFDTICKRGLVLSEYTPDTHASVYTFPQRNRIISGLCDGTLVVEASQKSGSLITADFALEQDRDVFAVPGDIDKPRSFGTNSLIAQGATAVTSAKDILDFYGMKSDSSGKKMIELDFGQQHVLDILSDSEKTFDALVESSGMSISALNAALSSLIGYGMVHETANNVYCADKDKD